MAVALCNVLLPLFMMICASPVAFFSFRAGIPIELIVFGLLFVGYKGPHWLKRCRGAPAEPSRDHAESASNEPESHVAGGQSQDDSKAKISKQSKSWRANLPSWRSKNKTSSSDASDVGSWRRAAAQNQKSRQDEQPKKDLPKSGLSFLKKDSPEQKWRSIINKFTPEKFDKLCEQLLETLPKNTETNKVASEEYTKILDGLLALIFDASSRQHQYTEMYTNLCAKLLEFVLVQLPDLDGRGAIWGKCQQIFLTVVLKTPEFPADLPEDEYMDKKAKHKHMMVGMVKFGGDLVSHGLVPVDGVMHWIHALLSEKHLSGQACSSVTPENSLPSTAERAEEEDDHSEGKSETADAVRDKDLEEREVQLEVLCAILASMGSSLNDRTTWSEENRLVIEDVFLQLERLTMDTENLSTRMRCLIRDILDLRMAQWKEKEGKLKPTMLLSRNSDDPTAGLRSDAPEFVPGAPTAWRSDRADSGRPWLDPLLLATLEVVEHHLEVIDDKESKLTRLKALIQLYHFIQEQQLVIVANSSNVGKVVNLIQECFKEVSYKVLDFSTSEAVRSKHIESFEKSETSIIVMASEISTRRDFDFTPPSVLVNFDFPMTLQLYLYRIHKRAESRTHVYTFFSSHFDVRHAVPLSLALEGAKQKVPSALQKLRDSVKVEGDKSSKDSDRRPHHPQKERDGGVRRQQTPNTPSKPSSEADEDGALRGEGGHPWKGKSASEVEGKGQGIRDQHRDRDDRGAREDRLRHEHSRSEPWEEERGDRPPRDDRGGSKQGKGERRDGRPDGNWRDGKTDRREEYREEATGSPSSSRPVGDEQQVRRRDTARRNPEQGGEQKGNMRRQGGGGGGGRRDGDDWGSTDAGDRQRRQWSEGDASSSRTSGQASGSGQRLERTSSHGESNSERWPADGQNSSSSTVRQRRSEHPDSSHADGDGNRRLRVGGGDAGEAGHRERGHRGGDSKHSEKLQPGSVQIQTRGGNENHGHRRGNRQGDRAV